MPLFPISPRLLLRGVLVLSAPFLLAGCGPALIAGAIVLGLTLSKDDPCRTPGSLVEVTIEGQVRYQTRLQGGGAGPAAPVRGSRVEVLRLNCGEEVIAATETDGVDGSYSVTFTTPSGSVLRVSALARRTDLRTPAAIRNNSRERLLYSLESADLALEETPEQSYSIDLNAPLDCAFQLAGAFHLLEESRRGFEALENSQHPLPAPDRSLTIFWELGNPEGTFFSTTSQDLDGDRRGGDPFIQLRGGAFLPGCLNTDQFDDAIILHEFGHYVALVHSRDDSPGGPHSTAELVDPRVSWSEGWADFFSSMARNDSRFTDTFEVLARNGSRSCGLEVCDTRGFDLESKEATCAPAVCCQGIGSEEAVGAFLWDLFDPANETDDRIQLPRGTLLSALERLEARHFIYVGDLIEEAEGLAGPQAPAVRDLAEREAMVQDGQIFPFPSAFNGETRDGASVRATAIGAVNGCDNLLCKRFVENFIGSSRFHELEIPPASSVVSARLSLTSSDPGCSQNLELRIFNQEGTRQHTTAGQSGPTKEIRFSLDGTFRAGSWLLFEVAGDVESPIGSGRGEKGGYELNVDVD